MLLSLRTHLVHALHLAQLRTSVPAELAEVKAALQKHCAALSVAFTYYSNDQNTFKTADMCTMTLDMFRRFVAATAIIEKGAPTVSSMNELDSIFVAANFEESTTPLEAAANDDNALVRFEFVEILVRIALAKYIASRHMADASDAVQKLLEECVLPRLPEIALTDPNLFRVQRLYTEAAEVVLHEHWDFVTALFKVAFLACNIVFRLQHIGPLKHACKGPRASSRTGLRRLFDHVSELSVGV